MKFSYKNNISTLHLSYINQTFFYTFVYKNNRVSDSFFTNFIIHDFEQIKNTVLSIIAYKSKDFKYDRTFIVDSLYDFLTIACKKCYGL